MNRTTFKIICFIALAIALLLGGLWYNQSADKAQQAAAEKAATDQAAALNKIMSQLVKEDLVVGTGPAAQNGDLITVNYFGTLVNGQKFDSSYDRNQPFQFVLGAGQVIKGWDLGVLGMKVGGKRKLTIPGDLAYGPSGAGGIIGPNATLVFEVELLGVQ